MGSLLGWLEPPDARRLRQVREQDAARQELASAIASCLASEGYEARALNGAIYIGSDRASEDDVPFTRSARFHLDTQGRWSGAVFEVLPREQWQIYIDPNLPPYDQWLNFQDIAQLELPTSSATAQDPQAVAALISDSLKLWLPSPAAPAL